MKCQKPNTDQVCEAFISTNGRQYAEYILDPNQAETRNTPHHVLECFIPVHDGEKIKVHVRFQGTVLHGAVDVIADGAFIYDRRIEGDKRGALKYQRRSYNEDMFLNVPRDTDDETLRSGKAVVAGNLFVKALHEGDVPLYSTGRGKLGLGSIAVVVSVNQTTDEMYPQKYTHQSIGKWRDVKGNHADGGIKPTHELEFSVEDDEVHFNRQARHRRHFEQTRFGHAPWAIFVFHYRAQADIQNMPCIARPLQDVLLEPFLGEFVFADPDEIKKKRLTTRAKNQREKAEAAEEEEEEEESDDGLDGIWDDESGTGRSGHSEGLFVSRSPSHSHVEVSKQRLFGNSLGLSSASGNMLRKDSGIPKNYATAAFRPEQPQATEKGLDQIGDAVTEDNVTVAEPQQIAEGQGDHQDNSTPVADEADSFDFNRFPDMSGGELVGEIDQFLEAGGFNGFGGAPVATMVAPSATQDPPTSLHEPDLGDVVESVETDHDQEQPPQTQHPQQQGNRTNANETFQPSPLADMISSTILDKVNQEKAEKTARHEAKNAKKHRPPPPPKGKPVFDPTAKTGYGFGNSRAALSKSTAPTRQAVEQLNAQAQNATEMLQNYLQNQIGAQQYMQAPPQTFPYRPWENQQPPKNIQHPMSPLQKVVNSSMTVSSVAPSPQPAQATPKPQKASPHTVSNMTPRKRSASITSHPSTASSKKARTAENSARKAALLARLQEQKKAKEAAEQQLEIERQAREEMERWRREEERLQEEEDRRQQEAEEEELRELERLIEEEERGKAAVDEVRAREMEEAKMRELGRLREEEE